MDGLEPQAPGAITRRLVGGIRENLTERIAEAEEHGRLVEAEGPRVSLAAAGDELAQLDQRARRVTTIDLGIPPTARRRRSRRHAPGQTT